MCSMTESVKRSRPGRPRDEENTLRRRRDLVAAAYRVFTTKGYAAASTADIAAEMGAGYGTFYRYFDSKRAILDEVVDYGIDRLLTEVAADVFAPGDPDQEITEAWLAQTWSGIVERMCHVAESNPAMITTLLFELPGVDNELSQRVIGLGNVLAVAVDQFLRRAVDSGVLRAEVDTTDLAWMLLVLTIPPVLRTLNGQGEIERRGYAETVWTVLNSGLMKPQLTDG